MSPDKKVWVTSKGCQQGYTLQCCNLQWHVNEIQIDDALAKVVFFLFEMRQYVFERDNGIT